jgi:cytochrome c oxidase subunit I+III
MAMGFVLAALDIVLIFLYGKPFRRNPWKAGTLEWAMPTPPASYSFASIPHVSKRADDLPIDQLGAELAAGKGYLGFARNGWMESIGVDAVSGEANQIIILPRQTYLPLLTAIATGGFFLCLLLKLYGLAVVFLLATLGIFLLWTRNGDARQDRGPVSASPESTLPLNFESRDAPSILAMRLTLVANSTLFSSLLFGGLFLWVSAAPATSAITSDNNIIWITATAMAAGLCGILAGYRKTWNYAFLAVAFVGYLISSALTLNELLQQTLATSHALEAVKFAVFTYLTIHLMLGAVFSAFCGFRLYRGYISSVRQNDLLIARLWHGYCLAVTIVAAIYPFIFTVALKGS